MNAIDAKVYSLIDNLTTETVIIADQNTPRPTLPYWTINSGPRRHIGSESYSQGVTVDGDQEVRGEREFTVQLQRIGVDSDQAVQDLRDKLRLTTVMEQWWAANMALYNTSDVTILAYKMDDHLEPRAIIELFIRYQAKQLDRVGIIETLDITGNYETSGDPDTPGLDPDPDLTQNFIVSL